jgi:hypothetical protein
MTRSAKILTLVVWFACLVGAGLLAHDRSLELDLDVGVTLEDESDSLFELGLHPRAIVTEVESDGAAYAAGLRVGDRVDRDFTFQHRMRLTPDDGRLSVSATSEGETRSLEIETESPKDPTSTLVAEIYKLGVVCASLAAALVLLLGRPAVTEFKLLSPAFIAYSIYNSPVSHSIVENLYLYTAHHHLWVLSGLACYAILIRFWVQFSESMGMPIGPRWRLFFQLFMRFACVLFLMGLPMFGLALYNLYAEVSLDPNSILERLNGAFNLALFVTLLVGIACCGVLPATIAWRAYGSQTDSVYWTVTTLTGVFLIALAKRMLSGFSWEAAEMLNALEVIFIIAFIYTALSKKVISYQFAINKGILYFGSALVLLLAFLWLKSNIQSLNQLNADAQVDMIGLATAVLIFAAKHANSIGDRLLKRFIFISLARRETALRTFISSMPHYESATRLAEAAKQAFSAYCKGSRVHILDEVSAEFFSCSDGVRVQRDSPEAVEMRRARAAVTPYASTSQASSFRLLVPGFHRAQLALILAIEDDGELPPFRPDEIKLLEDAVAELVSELAKLELDQLRKARESQDRCSATCV